MAQFCKIKSDGQIQLAPNPLRIVISNPTDERYRYEGFLEVIYTDPPEYDPETQIAESHFEEQSGKAVQVWEIKDKPVETAAEAEQTDEGTENETE